MKEKILELLKINFKPVSITEIKNRLQVTDIQDLYDALYELETTGYIIDSNNTYYRIPKDCIYKSGWVELSNKGNYYVKLENGEVVNFPKKRNSNLNIIVGDYVFFEIQKGAINKGKNNEKYKEGKVFHVTNRNNFLINNIDIEAKVLIDEAKKPYILYRNQKFMICSSDINKVQKNDIILTHLNIKNNECTAKLINTKYKEVNKDKFDINFVENLANDFNVSLAFPSEVLNETKNLTCDINEELNYRTDLRNLITITIDGVSAKDLDDAISILKINDDTYRIFVHIADVSYFVKPGSQLFEEALKRTTSIYPSNYVIPMLPQKLSNDLCSLNEGEDKLAKTVSIDINKDGEIIDFNIFNSIINSNFRMNYDSVNNFLINNVVENGYENYTELLNLMNNAAKILEKRRIKRGYLKFESSEYEYILDDNSEVIDIKTINKGPAQLLIENFMLLANEIIADYAINFEAPFIYRNHECPTAEQLFNLKTKLNDFNIHISTIKNANNPKIFQKILLSIIENKTEEEKIYISGQLLKNMNHANYSNTNLGHFGLALADYATFTSPIRRMPDLLNHLTIECLITGNLEMLTIYEAKYCEYAEKCSEGELLGETFERTMNSKLYNQFVETNMSDNLAGKIVSIYNNNVLINTNKGIFGPLKINNSQVRDNTIHINGKTYCIGDTLNVKIKNIKGMKEQVSFIINDEEIEKDDEYDKHKRK